MVTTRPTRLGFWLLLGCFSAVFAEVPSGSSPFVLVSPWGLLVTLPVYLLHAVVLATVVQRAGRTTLRTLLLAGGLFGLYEAYMTKVVWSPTWEPVPLRLGGVYVLETANLVFFWHPVVAFLLPLLAVEWLATGSSAVRDGLPGWLRSRPRRTALLAAVGLGLMQSASFAGRPLTLVLADAVAVAVLALLVALWRRRTWGNHALADLLPTRGEFRVLLGLLAALYVALGVLLRPEALPGLRSQATVWVLYLLVGGLLAADLRRARAGETGPAVRVVGAGGDLDRRPVAVVLAVYVGVGLAGAVVLGPLAVVVYLGLFAGAFVVGGWVLGTAVRDLVSAGRG